jgi:hypothetical protein
MSSLIKLRRKKEGSEGLGGSEHEDSGDVTSDDGKVRV